MKKLAIIFALLAWALPAQAQVYYRSSPTFTGVASPALVLYISQYDEFNVLLTANAPIQFSVPVISGTMYFRVNTCQNATGGYTPTFSATSYSGTAPAIVNRVGSAVTTLTANACDTEEWTYRQKTNQLVLESISYNTGVQGSGINSAPAGDVTWYATTGKVVSGNTHITTDSTGDTLFGGKVTVNNGQGTPGGADIEVGQDSNNDSLITLDTGGAGTNVGWGLQATEEGGGHFAEFELVSKLWEPFFCWGAGAGTFYNGTCGFQQPSTKQPLHLIRSTDVSPSGDMIDVETNGVGSELWSVDAVGAEHFFGSSSGNITLQPQAAAGTYNFNLPTTAGTSGQPLLSGGGGSSPMTFGTLGAGAGGSGLSNPTVHDLFIAEGSSNFNLLNLGADTFLQGVASADPQAGSLPNCANDGAHALVYSTSTHSLSCASISVNGQAIFTHALTGATPTAVVNSTSVPATDVENYTLGANCTSFTLPGSTGVADGEVLHIKVVQPSGSHSYTFPATLTGGSGTQVAFMATGGCASMPTMPTSTGHTLLLDVVYNANTPTPTYDIVSCPTDGP